MEIKGEITELFGFEETYRDQKGKLYLCFRGWWQMLKMGCNCCKQASYIQEILIPG